jgi:hypothetical protein
MQFKRSLTVILLLSLLYGCNNTENIQKYKVTYDSNGSTSGNAPIDDNEYISNQYAIVRTNEGNLAKQNYLFAGWSKSALGNYGNDCEPNSEIQIEDHDLILYAKWVETEYDFNEVTGEIIAYNFTYNDVILPNAINNIPVTVIGDSVFYGRALRSVVIPQSIKKLGIRTFSNTRLKNINIPSSVEIIDSSCFQGSNLTKVDISNGLQYIKMNAFYRNSITSVKLPDTIHDIGQRAFANNKLTEVTVPKELTVINEGTFEYNEISNLIIPDGLKEIKEAAFLHNKLEIITLPSSITSIEKMAFGHNPITDINIGANVSIYSSYNYDGDNIFAMGLYGDSFCDYYIYKGKISGHYFYDGEYWHHE